MHTLLVGPMACNVQNKIWNLQFHDNVHRFFNERVNFSIFFKTFIAVVFSIQIFFSDENPSKTHHYDQGSSLGCCSLGLIWC